MNRDWLPINTTPWTMALLLAMLILLIQASALPERINLWLYDVATTSLPATPSDDVVIVAIDELSLNRIGRWPWPRSVHAEIIRKLHTAGADTIVFDILFPEP
ncbi:CHASE2 domain-containing protein, partial [Marinobacter alexandrii]